MKNYLLILVLLIFVSNKIISQEVYLTTSLRAIISEKSENDKIPVLIVLNKQLNYIELKKQFDENNLTENQRAKETIKLLQTQKETDQQLFIDDIVNYKFSNKFSIKYQYWICNMVLADVTKTDIDILKSNSYIRYIEYADNKIILDGEVSVDSTSKSANGTENGVKAINAPAMWALGYTGRGRLVYDYDTGVYPNHPAFSDRFLANFYPLNQCWYGYYSQIPTG